MFWRNHPVVLRRKGKVLVGASAMASAMAIAGFVQRGPPIAAQQA